MASPDDADAPRLLDAIAAERARRRRVDAAALVTEREETARRSPAERVETAFRRELPTENELKVVQVLLDNPDLTSSGLSRKCGWSGQIWHRFFGGVCRDREVYLWPAEPVPSRDAAFYCGILADLEPETHRWRVKPEAAEGLARLGIAAAGQ